MSGAGSDVLLLRPPVKEFLPPPRHSMGGSSRSYPIGLAYLAAALRGNGISAEILDAWARPSVEKAAPPRELGYLRGLSDLRDCSGPAEFYHQGMPDADIRDFLASRRFSIVGISSMFSGYHLEALRWADEAKRLMPGATVVLGGAAATASAELTLDRPSVDYVVLGEGEVSFSRLARAVLDSDVRAARSIPGVGFKVDGKARVRPREEFVPDLDALPEPAHDLIDKSFYRVAVGPRLVPYVGLFTSRGCPHRCDFCTIYISMGRRFRVHSPERVLAEIRRCHDRDGARLFNIEDDNFAFEPERAKAILRSVIREFGPRRLIFRNYNGMTALSLRDRELVSLMSEAGFDHVMIALESDDPEVRRIMRKPGTVGHFSAAAAACEKAGIKVGAFTIIGLPYSDVETDVGAQLFCLTQPMRQVDPVMYYPIPTTPQYDHCVRRGWVRPEPRFLPRLRAAAFAAARPGYTRRDGFTLLGLAKLFGGFKASARRLVPEGGRVSFREILDDRGKTRPFRVRERPRDEFLLDARERLEDRDILCAQVDLLVKRGLLTRVSGRTAAAAELKAVMASKRVLRLFLEGLPSHPLRYASGEEISWDRA
ncbi:MAG: B12-binding domain-containing radical SAM protein [Elusimicrobiota bacterium]